MKGAILKGTLATAGLLCVAWLAWRCESRWLRPPPPDANPWFPMRVGDRWTYHDSGRPDRVIFEVRSREESPDGSFFRVERRIGKERVVFDVSVTAEGCWILNAGGEAFSPPFQEFHFPLVEREEWRYGGRLGTRRVQITSRVISASGNQCEVEEFSSYPGTTRFILERGRGIVKLEGKEFDPHGSAHSFDWTLEEFRRG